MSSAKEKGLNISNKKFGYSFTLFFLFIAAALFAYQLMELMAIFLVSAFILFLITLFSSPWLSIPNKIWFKLSELLGVIISPVVLSLLFFLVLTPYGLLSRIFGRDILRLKPNNDESFWVERDPDKIDPESFKKQF